MRTLKMFLALVAVCLFAGCASPLPGNDPVVVRAEQVESISLEVVNEFLYWEYTTQPGGTTHQVAEKLRETYPKALGSLSQIKSAYKLHRTPDGKANLATAASVVQAMVDEVKAYRK